MAASSGPPIDEEALLSLLDQHRHQNGEPNTSRLAEALGCTRGGIQGALARLARQGRLGTRATLPGFSIKQISERIDAATGNPEKTWIKQAPSHGEPFEIPEGHAIKGVSALVDSEGQTIQQWIKTKAEVVDATAAIREAFAEYRGKSELILAPVETDAHLLTVYPIADFHLGMLAWGREVGKSWDLPSAKKELVETISQLIALSPPSKTGVILNLGDFVHADDSSNATPASGNHLDVDGRFPKIGKEAVRLHVVMVELALQRHESVIVRCIPGNHDPHVSQMITVALDLFFENNPRVHVDTDPSDFWWHRHGRVLLGANHGHKIKPEKMPGVMAAYRATDWGHTKWRYCYGGHIHHKSKGGGEEHGAVWETFQTLAAKDAYAHSHGYSSGRSLVSITHHEDRGEIMRQTVSI